MGFIIKDQRPRRPLAAPLIALLIVTTPLILTATADEAPQHLLATFHPGSPTEPAWTMLELAVPGPGEHLRVIADLGDVRCPFVWGFALFTGTPEFASVRASVTMNFAYGRSGVELDVHGPVRASPSSMEASPDRSCSAGRIIVTFMEVPEGTVYLLTFTAGTPFQGTATIENPQGGIHVRDSSAGNRTFYAGPTDFETTGMHAAAHTPGFCIPALIGPYAPDFCEDCCWQPGGVWGGADIGLNRWTELTFEHHPMFRFGVSAKVDVSRATVTDPFGVVKEGRAPLKVNDVGIRTGGPTISSSGVGPHYPPGTYRFDLHQNTDVDWGPGAYWVVYAVDFQFPEEQAA